MNRKKNQEAKILSKSHSEIEPGIKLIFCLCSQNENQDDEPIKLLEVNEDAVPTGVLPIEFGPGGDIHFNSIIVELTPEEYEKLLNKELELPNDWEIGEVLYSSEKVA